ncbi:hypothetical protein M0R45_019846 [Rubus argutus]|uniref:Uncharacterized protein n=1 Tax=Rubus argutus TaxID=59490 RepID=A0AAW1X6M7_RUBAR
MTFIGEMTSVIISKWISKLYEDFEKCFRIPTKLNHSKPPGPLPATHAGHPCRHQLTASNSPPFPLFLYHIPFLCPKSILHQLKNTTVSLITKACLITVGIKARQPITCNSFAIPLPHQNHHMALTNPTKQHKPPTSPP